MFDLILSVAKNDVRVRAVILNGSRVNNKIVKDDLQDFDIVFLVEEFDSFIDLSLIHISEPTRPY